MIRGADRLCPFGFAFGGGARTDCDGSSASAALRHMGQRVECRRHRAEMLE